MDKQVIDRLNRNYIIFYNPISRNKLSRDDVDLIDIIYLQDQTTRLQDVDTSIKALIMIPGSTPSIPYIPKNAKTRKIISVYLPELEFVLKSTEGYGGNGNA